MKVGSKIGVVLLWNEKDSILVRTAPGPVYPFRDQSWSLIRPVPTCLGCCYCILISLLLSNSFLVKIGLYPGSPIENYMDLYLMSIRYPLRKGWKITIITSLAIGIIIGPNYPFKYIFKHNFILLGLHFCCGYDFLPEESIESGWEQCRYYSEIWNLCQ